MNNRTIGNFFLIQYLGKILEQIQTLEPQVIAQPLHTNIEAVMQNLNLADQSDSDCYHWESIQHSEEMTKLLSNRFQESAEYMAKVNIENIMYSGPHCQDQFLQKLRRN